MGSAYTIHFNCSKLPTYFGPEEACYSTLQDAMECLCHFNSAVKDGYKFGNLVSKSTGDVADLEERHKYVRDRLYFLNPLVGEGGINYNTLAKTLKGRPLKILYVGVRPDKLISAKTISRREKLNVMQAIVTMFSRMPETAPIVDHKLNNERSISYTNEIYVNVANQCWYTVSLVLFTIRLFDEFLCMSGSDEMAVASLKHVFGILDALLTLPPGLSLFYLILWQSSGVCGIGQKLLPRKITFERGAKGMRAYRELGACNARISQVRHGANECHWLNGFESLFFPKHVVDAIVYDNSLAPLREPFQNQTFVRDFLLGEVYLDSFVGYIGSFFSPRVDRRFKPYPVYFFNSVLPFVECGRKSFCQQGRYRVEIGENTRKIVPPEYPEFPVELLGINYNPVERTPLFPEYTSHDV